MTLGEKITTLRKQHNYSQADVSRALEISRDTISKYERDEMVPSVEKAKKIADLFEVSLDYLVSEKAEEPVLDKQMVRRVQEIQHLERSDQDKILSVLDAFIRDAKTRQAYSF